MACGIGVCMTCVLPVVGDDGVTRMVRSCVEGPVFRGDRVRWADVGTVPPDALGAPGGPADAMPAGGAGRDRAGGRRGRHVDARSARLPLPNPVLTASGCAAAGRELEPFVDSPRIGAVVTKSIMLRPAVRPADAADGRDAERDAQLDRPAGPRHRRVPRARPALAARARAPGRWSRIAGGSVEEYAELATPAARARRRWSAIEVNISCPNVEDRGQVFACDPDAAARVVAAVRAEHAGPAIPVLAKLSPGRHRHRRRRPGLRAAPAPTGCR